MGNQSSCNDTSTLEFLAENFPKRSMSRSALNALQDEGTFVVDGNGYVDVNVPEKIDHDDDDDFVDFNNSNFDATDD